jgi:hypothetical protein
MAFNPHWFGPPTTTPHRHRRKEEEYTHLPQETTRAKIERLCSVKLIHQDQKNTTRHEKGFNKANELISLLAPTLNTIKHVISQIKLISMKRFVSYPKHAKVTKQILINVKP